MYIDSLRQLINALLDANHELEMNSGMVFAVPIPSASAADAASIQHAIDTAIAEARANNVHGKEETPFLLKRIAELTKGESLAASKSSFGNENVIEAHRITHARHCTCKEQCQNWWSNCCASIPIKQQSLACLL